MISVTYFFYDFIIEAWLGVLDIPTMIHHIIVVIFGASFIWNEGGAFEQNLCLLLGEISNPFLIARTLLKLSGRKETTFYTVMEAIFAATWLAVRLILAPLIYAYYVGFESIPLFQKLGVSSIIFVSCHWNIQILSMMFKKGYESYGFGWCEPIYYWMNEMYMGKGRGGRRKKIVYLVAFILIYAIPFVRYGLIEKTLFTVI